MSMWREACTTGRPLQCCSWQNYAVFEWSPALLASEDCRRLAERQTLFLALREELRQCLLVLHVDDALAELRDLLRSSVRKPGVWNGVICIRYVSDFETCTYRLCKVKQIPKNEMTMNILRIFCVWKIIPKYSYMYTSTAISILGVAYHVYFVCEYINKGC